AERRSGSRSQPRGSMLPGRSRSKTFGRSGGRFHIGAESTAAPAQNAARVITDAVSRGRYIPAAGACVPPRAWTTWRRRRGASQRTDMPTPEIGHAGTAHGGATTRRNLRSEYGGAVGDAGDEGVVADLSRPPVVRDALRAAESACRARSSTYSGRRRS